MNHQQNKIKEFCKKYNLEMNPEERILDINSELGEISKEILKSTNYGRDTKNKIDKEAILLEIGDLLYASIALANSLDIDVEEALDKTLKKYENRLKKGSPGSEND